MPPTVNQDVITKFKTDTKDLNRGLDKTKKKAHNFFSSIEDGMFRFNMNTLTVLFTTMALKNILQGIFRSAVTTFQRANEDVEGLGKSTWELLAAWEFLKYSLIEALTQSELFKMFVEWLVQLVKKFNELSGTTKALIAIALIFVFLAATVAFLAATFIPLIEYLGIFSGGLTSTSLLSGIGTFGKFALWLVIGYLALVALDELLKAFGTDLGGVGKVLLILGKIIASVFILASAGTRILVNLVLMAMGSIVLGVKGTINFIILAFEGMVNIGIKAINALINAWNKVASKLKLPKIDPVGGVSFSGALLDTSQDEAMIANLLSRTDEIGAGARGALSSLWNPPSVPSIGEGGSFTQNNNQTQSFNFNFDNPAGGSPEELYLYIKNRLTQDLNDSLDSTNG